MQNGTFAVFRDVSSKFIRLRMTGNFKEEEMRAFCKAYREATTAMGGKPHVVLADMRGMVPASPEVAGLLGEAIGWARLHGVHSCAHLSDHTVQRLQAKRIARESTPDDRITVDVENVDEAERVCVEACLTLGVALKDEILRAA